MARTLLIDEYPRLGGNAADGRPPRAGHWYRRYFEVGKRERAWGLFVSSGGFLQVAPHVHYPPAGHPDSYDLDWDFGRRLEEYQLHVIASGRGHFESRASGCATIKAGSVFLLFPGEWHRYRPDPSVGWQEYWIGFGGQQAARMMAEPFFSRSHPIVQPADQREMLRLCQSMVTAMREDNEALPYLLSGALHMLVAQCLKRVNMPKAKCHRDTLSQAEQYIAEHMESPLHGPSLAAELGVGYHWLRRTFRDHTGLTMTQYHRHLRVRLAMELLDETDLPLADIAERIGVEDVYYFSRLFRKTVGSPPQRWRQQRRGAQV